MRSRKYVNVNIHVYRFRLSFVLSLIQICSAPTSHKRPKCQKLRNFLQSVLKIQQKKPKIADLGVVCFSNFAQQIKIQTLVFVILYVCVVCVYRKLPTWEMRVFSSIFIRKCQFKLEYEQNRLSRSKYMLELVLFSRFN